ncbi:MAG TPA: GtrA family protein [Rhizomicrobium sp.]|nr:GtrA family protein [Rhizomicrobium sp.]
MTFLLYCICGGTGVATDYAVFYLVVSAGAWYQAANIVSYGAGTLVSFALNRVITFKKRDRTWFRLAMFISVAACGYLCSAGLLWLLVTHFRMDAKIAKLLTLPVVVFLQYGLNRHVSFRDWKAAHEP